MMISELCVIAIAIMLIIISIDAIAGITISILRQNDPKSIVVTFLRSVVDRYDGIVGSNSSNTSNMSTYFKLRAKFKKKERECKMVSNKMKMMKNIVKEEIEEILND